MNTNQHRDGPGKWNLQSLLWLCLAAAGCETAPLMTEQMPDTDFARYRTFALLPMPAPDTTRNSEQSGIRAKAAGDAAIAILNSKGYSSTATNNADLLISLEGESLPGISGDSTAVTRIHTTRGSATVVDGGPADEGDYSDSSLRVHAFDARSGKLVWRGWTRRVSSVPLTPEAVQYAVRRILERFPSTAPP